MVVTIRTESKVMNISGNPTKPCLNIKERSNVKDISKYTALENGEMYVFNFIICVLFGKLIRVEKDGDAL
jgi:hypothetical protein